MSAFEVLALIVGVYIGMGLRDVANAILVHARFVAHRPPPKDGAP